MSLSNDNAPEFQVVADHRFDRLETIHGARPAWAGGPPALTYRVHCKCGEHSEAVAAPGTAHQWHEVHRERVLKALVDGA